MVWSWSCGIRPTLKSGFRAPHGVWQCGGRARVAACMAAGAEALPACGLAPCLSLAPCSGWFHPCRPHLRTCPRPRLELWPLQRPGLIGPHSPHRPHDPCYPPDSSIASAHIFPGLHPRGCSGYTDFAQGAGTRRSPLGQRRKHKDLDWKNKHTLLRCPVSVSFPLRRGSGPGTSSLSPGPLSPAHR